MKTCHICDIAFQCMDMATTKQARDTALDGYLNHLKRDHKMTQDDLAGMILGLLEKRLIAAQPAIERRQEVGA